MAQFIFDVENLCPGALELRECPPKKLEHDFWSKGQNLKIKISKMKFLNTLQSCNIKVGDILQFMGILKPKLSISQKGRVIRTKINVQKSPIKSFLINLGKKNFYFFNFFVDTLYIWNIFSPLFWSQINLTLKVVPIVLYKKYNICIKLPFSNTHHLDSVFVPISSTELKKVTK